MTRHFGSKSSRYTGDRTRAVLVMVVCTIIFFSAIAFILIGFKKKDPPAATKIVEVVKETQIDMVDVLVPIQNIEPGRPLEPTMFRKVQKPKLGIAPRAVRDFEQIKGAFARTLIVAEQTVTEDYITKARPVNEIIRQIPDGFRAVSIRVDQISSVEGWARPGAQVDILWSAAVNGVASVTTIVENAKVLSAERATQTEVKPGAPVPSTVTLLVSTEDSKKIQLAVTTGSLSLLLRGENSKAGSAGTLTVNDLYGKNGKNAGQNDCKGRVKLCSDAGKCEILCLKPDGEMVPLESP